MNITAFVDRALAVWSHVFLAALLWAMSTVTVTPGVFFVNCGLLGFFVLFWLVDFSSLVSPSSLGVEVGDFAARTVVRMFGVASATVIMSVSEISGLSLAIVILLTFVFNLVYFFVLFNWVIPSTQAAESAAAAAVESRLPADEPLRSELPEGRQLDRRRQGGQNENLAGLCSESRILDRSGGLSGCPDVPGDR